MAENLQKKKQELDTYKKRLELSKQEVLRNNKVSLQNDTRNYKKQIQSSKNNLEKRINNVDRLKKEAIAQRDVDKMRNDNQLKDLKHQLATAEFKAGGARKIKEKEMNLEKELLDDPTQQKIKKMNIVEQLYKKISMGGMKMNIMGNDNPVQHIMQQFDELTSADDAK